jgi:hypothetical protein
MNVRRRRRHYARPPASRAALRASVLALALVAGACANPFKPADPEDPSSSGPPVVEDFRTPEALLETIVQAIQNRSSNGASAYLRAFAESTVAGDRAYRSFYDGAVKSTWQSATQLTAPEPWDVTLERNLHTQLSSIRPTYLYQFVWLPDPLSPQDDDPAASDTVQYHRKYTLFAAPENGNPEIIAIGFADLSMQKKEGRWSITRWHDRVDPNVGVNPAATDQRTMSWWRLESLVRR